VPIETIGSVVFHVVLLVLHRVPQILSSARFVKEWDEKEKASTEREAESAALPVSLLPRAQPLYDADGYNLRRPEAMLALRGRDSYRERRCKTCKEGALITSSRALVLFHLPDEFPLAPGETVLLNSLLMGEQMVNVLISLPMARRPESEKAEILSEKDLEDLRHNLAHLSVGAVRDFYERSYRDCRLIYSRLPSPKQMQTLVQVWKQLWKWR
jgi:hypothetical protein